ncbi:oplophorus-luciferin 2-monooxygenase non-catalytic subunit-like [Penaeus monodon]|uniref:oplophorus-luciferin 2-monooxygenase non-catalytic subunit-like n=1 Tax=Penaeus monodon TaxID=6687 RepID=UPI0018A74CF7|nr:oplophorus-luciferin 2-monooxygenase non-catalytic subunit-like [Penaeus monodon]
MSDVPVDGFKRVPNLEVFYFEGNNLQQITPGTFAGLPHLRNIYIPNNKLSRIQEGALAVASDFFQDLVLSGNDISIIEPFAITGISGADLRLDGNSLTVLDEAVFRPLLEDKVSIFLEGNPLSCECDVAWLVTRPDLMAWIADDAACFNGQLLADLDPAMYENLC